MAKGYCRPHYLRLHRTGDVMADVPIRPKVSKGYYGRDPEEGEVALYRLLDSSGACRYIGQTSQLLCNRVSSHTYNNTIGERPTFEVIMYVREDEALALEALAIQAGVEAGLDLVNNHHAW